MKDLDKEDYYLDEDYDYEEQENNEPDYYFCTCCHHTQFEQGMGNGCDNCGMFNVLEEGYF